MAAAPVSRSNLIFPALVTPLTADGRLDVTSAERLIKHLYAQGVGGLYVMGSTGEGIYLDFAIRKELTELAVSLSRGRGQVIVHVGAVQAAGALELAGHATSIGADAVSSLPPFVGNFSWDEVVAYYEQLCRASPLPVVAYHIPAITRQTASVEQLLRIAVIPGIGGFKFTDYNLYQMQRLLARLPGDQIVFNGADEMLALGLAMGAHGGIGTTYNFMPKLVLETARHCAAGRLAEALVVQKQMNEVIEVLLSYQGLSATKQILYWQGLIASPRCTAPRAMLTEGEQATLRRRLMETAIADSLVR